MVKRLINSVQMHVKNMLCSFAFFLGFWFLGTLIMSIILWADGTETAWLCMGSILSLVAMSGIMVLLSWNYHQEFMLALSMGQTRREFMITYALRQSLWVIAAYSAILLLYSLEGLFYQFLFPERTQLFALGFLTDWRFMLPFVPGMVLLNMFLGAMYSRYGMKIWRILYFVWIFSFFFLSRMINYLNEYTGPFQARIRAVAAWIFAVPPAAWAAAGLAVVAVMAVTVVRFGMKQMVR